MNLNLAESIRVERVDGEAIAIDRDGLVVHRVGGDTAAALDLVMRGIDQADVPAHLMAGVDELLDHGIVVAPGWSRRKLLKMAGATMAGASIATFALATPAAAATGSVTTDVRKTVNNNTNVPLSDLCTMAASGNSARGTAIWTRTESAVTNTNQGGSSGTFGPPSICVTAEMTTGTKVDGRDVYILQSDGTNCLSRTTPTRVGVWPGDPNTGTGDRGPYTFCTTVQPGATHFVIAFEINGGGGSDTFSSSPLAFLP